MIGRFGDWLAGFIDDEGCFLVPYRSDRGHWYCQFRIRVRADEMAIIREIHERTGIGRVFEHPQRGSAPLACWEVSSRADCQRLVEIIEAHPLRAKKARDFAIWREAVAVWSTTTRGGDLSWRRQANVAVWEQMERLSRSLREGRKYLLEVAGCPTLSHSFAS